MAELIEKLTRRIYDEGVQKAKDEGEKIIAQAKTEAAKIIEEAKQQSASILVRAKKDSEILKKNTEAEIKMTAQKAVSALKQSIEKLITQNIAAVESGALVKDSGFLKKLMEKAADEWLKSGSLGEALIFKVSDKDAKDVEAYFKAKAGEMLGKKIIVMPDERIKAGFVVEPKDGSFKIGFTEEDFNEFLKGLARDSIKGFLFN